MGTLAAHKMNSSSKTGKGRQWLGKDNPFKGGPKASITTYRIPSQVAVSMVLAVADCKQQRQGAVGRKGHPGDSRHQEP